MPNGVLDSVGVKAGKSPMQCAVSLMKDDVVVCAVQVSVVRQVNCASLTAAWILHLTASCISGMTFSVNNLRLGRVYLGSSSAIKALKLVPSTIEYGWMSTAIIFPMAWCTFCASGLLIDHNFFSMTSISHCCFRSFCWAPDVEHPVAGALFFTTSLYSSGCCTTNGYPAELCTIWQRHFHERWLSYTADTWLLSRLTDLEVFPNLTSLFHN